MDRTETLPRPDSQSRLSPLLFWFLLAALLFRIVSAVMNRGGAEGIGLIRWQPLEKAGARSAVTGKPILYDFTAAWCGPCKLVDALWQQDDVADLVNDGFVPVRIVDRVQEDGRNPPEIAELLRRYEVSGFPTLVAASSDGRLLEKEEGFRGREALVRFLGQARGK